MEQIMEIKIKPWLADKEKLPSKKFKAEYIRTSASGKAIQIIYNNKDIWIPISQILTKPKVN